MRILYDVKGDEGVKKEKETVDAGVKKVDAGVKKRERKKKEIKKGRKERDTSGINEQEE